MSLQRQQIERVVAMALEEDAPWGDVTSQTFVPATTTATAELVAREPGIFAGAEVFEVAMTALDDTVKVSLLISRTATTSTPVRCWPGSRGRRGRSCRPSGSRSTSCSGCAASPP